MIGVAVTILAANALNVFFGWETAAIVCGLVLGLEAGFWSGVPSITREVHVGIFRVLLSSELRDGVKTIIYYTTAVAGIALAAYMTFKTATWLFSSQPWLLSLATNGTAVEDINNTRILAMGSSVLLALFLTGLSEVNLSDFFLGSPYRRLKCCLLHLPIGLAVGLTVPVALPLFFAAAALMLGLTGVLLITLIVYGLLKVAARYEAATITIGVIVGGISGLCYGRWTQLAFGPTLLSIVVGSTVGLTSAYSTYRIGRLVQTANKPATATAS